MNKHSPGPWKIDVLRCGGSADVVDAQAWNVAKVYYDEGRANLRLILAAPSLLALTRRLIDWGKWQCPPSENDEHCTGCWWQERDCPLMEAEALLEKIAGKGDPTMVQRKVEFLWEESPKTNVLILWCNEEYRERIKALDGVARVWNHTSKAAHSITFDRRYDIEEIKAAIEAVITGEAHA